MGNEGDFNFRCVLVKVRDGIPQPQSVDVWYTVAQNSYFNINRKRAPFVMKPETAIITLGDWIGKRDGYVSTN